MKRALIIGIDHYKKAPLQGCVNDALKIGRFLEFHEDGSRNFHAKYLLSSTQQVTTKAIKAEIEGLLTNPGDTALFYFAGHGTENILGGYLVSQDAQQYQEGVSMTQLIQMANRSLCREVVILVDACHSGHLGNLGLNGEVTLREGISLLCSSLKSQLSYEKNGGGVFTTIACEALGGGGADLIGHVSLASVYNFADRLLDPWEQRPMFKAHLSRSVVLRKCLPKIDLKTLRKLPEYFPTRGAQYPLSIEYEPSLKPVNDLKHLIFNHFQQFRAQGLLEPIQTKHLYHAALESDACRLTPLGQFYWKMVKKGMI